MSERDEETARAGVVDEAPRPASWETRAPDESWWPAALAPHVAWSGEPPPREHEWSDVVRADGWSAVGASRRGRLHAHRGEHREDAFRVTPLGGRLLLVASDGAGSSRWSRVGAAYACRRLGELLAPCAHDADGPLGPALSDAVRTICRELRALAREGGGEVRDLRCTLVAAVLSPASARGGARLESAQIGDGVLAVRQQDGAVERIGVRDGGEFSGDVTCFVPDAEAEERASLVISRDLGDVDAVLLATDGVEDPFYPIERHGALLLAQLRDGVREPAAGFQRQAPSPAVLGADDAGERLLAWLAFEKRGENDDRTLLVAWRDAGADA